MPIDCPSRIREVVVYARGALVTRAVEVPLLPEGDVELAVAGLPLAAEPASFRAALPACGRSIGALHALVDRPDAVPRAAPALERLVDLDARLARLEAEVARRGRLRAGLCNAAPRPPGAQLARPGQLGPRLQDALAVSALLDRLVERQDGSLQGLLREKERLQRERDSARLEAAQAAAPSRDSRPRLTRSLRLELTGRGGAPGLAITYSVPAARWWPAYALRLADGGRSGSWQLLAQVAHLGGEEWSGVRLSLSTADLHQDARLPELRSLRFGRAQPARRPAWRPPPEGLDRLFAAYDLGFPNAAPTTPPPAPAPRPIERAAQQDSAPFPPQAVAPAPPRAKAPAPATARTASFLVAAGAAGSTQAPASRAATLTSQAPQAPPASQAATAESAASPPPGSAGGGGPPPLAAEQPPQALEPSSGWLDYDGLSLAGPDSPRRGQLVRASAEAGVPNRRAAAEQLEALTPAGLRDPRDGRGRFDHLFPVPGLADVPSDGLLHQLTLGEAVVEPALRLRCVPIEEAKVFREVALRNPFDAPLLAGPVEVTIDGARLGVTDMDRTDRGGTLTVGLGVEERVRVSRNVRSQEGSAGLLGGSTAILHEVQIELASALGRPVEVEVLDRVPVSDDRRVEIERLSADPEPADLADAKPEAQTGSQQESQQERPVRGGLLFRARLEPGGRTRIAHSYRVVLSARDELIGGNRRG
jgi:hypothetical protein